MKKIIVSVTNDLTTDQRVEKVCNSLHTNGYEVYLVGRLLKNSVNITRNYATKRFKLFFNSGALFYAEYNVRLFFFLLFKKKDILLSNDVDTLLANYFISKIQHKKLVFDSHELFSEIPELVHRPKVKKVWNSIENWILPKLKNNYTVCNSIANYYQNKYNVNFKTILNVPNKKNLENGVFPFETHQKKIIIYQGAVNIGRGLELMIETMQHLENHLLVVIGSGDIYKDLKKKTSTLKLNDKVFFLGKKKPDELKKLTPLADVGFSLEEDFGLNYKFALPNKIFDYIQAEVPVIVSNLPEMKQLITTYKVGEVIEYRKPKLLANQIKKILEKDFSNELKEAKKTLIWENQEKKLLAIFKNAK
ncbi:glycosyltransferase [Polaribacter batillariae]|uniref:Glycosyltransferase n=1 Tax=Polaribacter batillariae TaxID=2808900 RepID=A0ABX7SW06_9FLAO|nr:glycosyltransferase [Polaribacter batillariae]QTD37033.1 glycosyltransferase [Polaribacter batillariae]